MFPLGMYEYIVVQIYACNIKSLAADKLLLAI